MVETSLPPDPHPTSRMLSETKAAGGLLVAGAAVFFGLGFGSLVLPDGPTRKAWVGPVVCVAFSITALAFVLLARVLRATPGGAWAELAAGLVLLGTPLLVVVMLFYATVAATVPAADPVGWQTAGDTPEGATARWGDALVTAYMALAFLGIAALGAALLAWPPAPRWLAWGSVALGLALAATLPLKFVVRFWPGDLPLWVHVWGAVVGVWLLRVT